MFPLDSFRQEDLGQTHSVQSSRVDIGGLLTEDQEYTEMMLMSKAGLLEGEYRGARVHVDKKELVEMQASRKR